MIGNTDSSFFGFIFPAEEMTTLNSKTKGKTSLFLRMVHNRKAFVPVVIANRGRESSSTDSVAHHVDQLTEPELYPKSKYLQEKK